MAELLPLKTHAYPSILNFPSFLSFRMFAFQRMKEAGAHLTTSESVILGLCGGSDHPDFREIQKIIWDSAPDSGLLHHTIQGETPV